MKKYLFVDLDDTLFSTLAKCGPEHDLKPAAFLKDGSAISYTTAGQRAFIQMMGEGMTLVPTTARNHDALKRVDMPFSDYKIINYGGVILRPDDSPDPAWLERMRGTMEAALPGLRQAVALLDSHAEQTGYGGRARLIDDFGLSFYVVLKDPGKVGANLAAIAERVVAPWLAGEGRDFYLHLNGNNLAILPRALNKAHAVQYLMDELRLRHGAIMTMGMGDSRSDAGFMALCDYAVVPKGTQLAGLTVAAL